LAKWIASRGNPLTARVCVQRLWQHHFGRGLLATPSDFGTRGDPPTHPELLDWLAVELMGQGWSLKKLHNLMLLSATYQESSKATPVALRKDPENRLLSRANRRRLEGETIRDSLLAVSGRLNIKMGGPGVFPPVPAEALRGSGLKTSAWTQRSDPEDHKRLRVYIFSRR